MKFWEAMKALEEGKKVKPVSKGWDPNNPSFSSMHHLIEYITIIPGIMYEKEWAIDENPPALLTFADVVKGLIEGKKFRRKCWTVLDSFIESADCKYFPDSSKIMNQYGTLCPLWIEDFVASDWEEVK